MSDIRQVNIDEKYIVRDKSSSDGTQIKYNMDNNWYKVDYFGGEGETEHLSSLLLSCTNLDSEKYVMYNTIKINGDPGCVSSDFRKDKADEFITLYRLYKNIYGKDLASVTSKMDYDDAIEYVIDFVKKSVGLDITSYLANVFWLDAIILNTDRHFNNYGIIMHGDEYFEAPIFDNGKSLLTGTNIDLKSSSLMEATGKVYSKSFSPNFSLNYNYLKQYCTIKLDKDRIFELLQTKANSVQKQVLEHQLRKLSHDSYT